uniref:Zn(2)-C6 fungal-type domain-containing protein n=1 Tax=Kwoniella bestiolae CBS 10118 TaxID=1296100 RepID=A0A1B9GEG1_9TREE|nr:hypothetical protein I302_00957 [Kwoniella bestiolae CBS 10118]OCF29452.1 hypothetical protein I302_00957 [Kwoniella bestiolae CBS 10118]
MIQHAVEYIYKDLVLEVPVCHFIPKSTPAPHIHIQSNATRKLRLKPWTRAIQTMVLKTRKARTYCISCLESGQTCVKGNNLSCEPCRRTGSSCLKDPYKGITTLMRQRSDREAAQRAQPSMPLKNKSAEMTLVEGYKAMNAQYSPSDPDVFKADAKFYEQVSTSQQADRRSSPPGTSEHSSLESSRAVQNNSKKYGDPYKDDPSRGYGFC